MQSLLKKHQLAEIEYQTKGDRTVRLCEQAAEFAAREIFKAAEATADADRLAADYAALSDALAAR